MERKSVFVQEIYTECEIDAPAHAVYAVISDFANYGRWTDEMTVSGDTHPGGNMHVHVKTARNGEGWYKLRSKMERNSDRIIAFSNVLFARFLFLGRHRFKIISLSKERTKFINAEVFSGLLVPFVRKKSLLIVTRRFKENVNASLKKTVRHFSRIWGQASVAFFDDRLRCEAGAPLYFFRLRGENTAGRIRDKNAQRC